MPAKTDGRAVELIESHLEDRRDLVGRGDGAGGHRHPGAARKRSNLWSEFALTGRALLDGTALPAPADHVDHHCPHPVDRPAR